MPAPTLPTRINQRAVTHELRKLASQPLTIDNEGNPVTREQQLADLLWNKALGYEEEFRDDDGNLKKLRHKPESWAIQYLYDRLEGKIAPTVAEATPGIKASERVRQLSKDRINGLTKAVAPSGPPLPKLTK